MSAEVSRPFAVEFLKNYYNALSSSPDQLSEIYSPESSHYYNGSFLEGKETILDHLKLYKDVKYSAQEITVNPLSKVTFINVSGKVGNKKFYHSFTLKKSSLKSCLRSSTFFNDDSVQESAKPPQPVKSSTWASAVGNSAVKSSYVKGIMSTGVTPKPTRTEKVERKDRTQDNQLFVGNLDETIDDESLEKYFEQFGPVKTIRVVRNSFKDVVRFFAFVEYYNADSVVTALDLPEHLINGRKVNVQLRRPKREEAN